MLNLGKWWGPKDHQPIVAIHGWQDNCGTFDTLIALMPSNVAVLALDMPGHGHSSHFPIGQFYHVLWDGLLSLRRIVKYYKWNKVSQQTKVIQRLHHIFTLLNIYLQIYFLKFTVQFIIICTTFYLY